MTKREEVARAIYDSHSFVKDWNHPDTVRLWHPVCLREADAAIAALRNPGWQLIDETFDAFGRHLGVRVLFYVPPYGATTGHYADGRWHLHSVLNRDAVPTHWQLLPDPPEET